MNVGREVAALKRMTVAELRARYAEVSGEATRCRHKDYLVRRIAWQLQAGEEGGISERARRRAEELAQGADVRLTPPREGTKGSPQRFPPRRRMEELRHRSQFSPAPDLSSRK